MFNLNFFHNSIIPLFLSFVRGLFSSNSTMSAIWNVLPIKKRKQTKKLGNSSNITQHVSASIPRTIFQNKNKNVQRFNSLVDPGTSSGKVVVGRVKIPIPKVFDQRKVGSFHLIRSDEKGLRLEGNILLSMTLQKIKLFCW
ncbi:hypothetical protein P8452_20706 [Trifolium repens]|nr:hypothetical protein P8452_20706 [Trifolium repens]